MGWACKVNNFATSVRPVKHILTLWSCIQKYPQIVDLFRLVCQTGEWYLLWRLVGKTIVCPKLDAAKIVSVSISETTVGLLLSRYRWKALPEQNMNMQKYFNNTLLLLNPNRMKNMHFCPWGPASSRFSQVKALFLQIGNILLFPSYCASRANYKWKKGNFLTVFGENNEWI